MTVVMVASGLLRTADQRLYQAAEQLGLEGIIGKRADSAYVRGRSPNWLKIKTGAGRVIEEERAKWNE